MKERAELLKEIAKYDLEDDLNKKFPKVWSRLANNPNISAQDNPTGVLLGGQPGAGKSFATMEIKERLKNNVLVINGDEFRSYHKHYENFYQLYGKDASKYTGAFAGKMVEKVRDEAIKQRFNVVIEGTFRTVETPLKELQNFQENKYKANVIVCTCPKELSWQSTIKRAEELKLAGLQPRYVPKEHHDTVTDNLAKNTSQIFSSGLVSNLEIYSREAKLFDSQVNSPNDIEKAINNELNGLNKNATEEKNYQIDFTYNRELSEKIGKKSYDVLVNGMKADELLKTDHQLSKALEGLANHKDIKEKGISADSLKSGTVQPLQLTNEFKVNKPESRLIDSAGSKISAKELSASKVKSSYFYL
ncbi:zeta toxin family protein [Haemophilus influenzae]|uniref:zeta toxin family protein n=1 Tax=Haemophilus influenzae TaxID=727 RepID=UPI000DD3B108|nr:zeta toxin family protein [Haemophilus influenzae]